MRIYDAYRQGLLTIAQYQARLDAGETPNAIYIGTEIEVPEYSHYISGTSIDTSVSIISESISNTIKQSIVIKNTGTTNSINAIIEYYIADILVRTISETIANSTTFLLETEYAASDVNVKISDTVSGSHSTYEIGIVAF